MVDAPPAYFTPTGELPRSFWDELDLLNILNGTGIPERLAVANELLNPIAAIPRAQAASQEMFAPNRTGWERAGSLAQVLGEVAGVAAPMVGAAYAGKPAINALAEGLTGVQASAGNALGNAADVGRRFAADESGALRLGGVETPEMRAQTILDMLQSGRASEVTDEMLDLGDPVANARLNQYLYRNYDLPMDEASRMQRAREMGFDTGTPLYHGTGADFRFFEPSSRTGHIGSYFAKDPGILPDYFARDMTHGGYRDGGNIMQTFARSPAPLDITERGALIGDDDTNQFMRDMGLTPSDLIQTGLRGDDNMFELVENPDVAEKLSEKWTSIDFMDSFDGSPEWNRAVTDPRNIRSRFARFDPRLAYLKNLSAGVAGVGFSGAALAPQDAQAGVANGNALSYDANQSLEDMVLQNFQGGRR